MFVRVLGPARVGQAATLSSQRQRRLLAALAAGGGSPVPAETLIDVAWGDRAVAHPSAALQTQLSRLRALLAACGGGIRAEGSGYRLDIAPGAVDAWRFEKMVDAARDEPGRIAVLTEALALWCGGAFADAAEHPAVRPAAVHLEELHCRAVEDLAIAHLDAGRADRALAVVAPLLAASPLRERARAIELRALYAVGRGSEALARYAEHRRLLAEDFGTDPSPLLTDVVRAILGRQLPTDAVPLSPAGALPARPVSSFVGRDRQLQQLVNLLRVARVVSLLGPAGVGKTRLALHACHEVRPDYADGVWWCDLAQAAPGEVTTIIATRLRVHERTGESLLERVATVVGHRRALVVLDNCEHVLAEVGALADALIRRGDGVDVLATSRGPIGIDGEHRMRLAPLPLPEDNGSGAGSPAVALFLDRARAAAAGFDPRGRAWSAMVELCRSVGGLPLALELAAVWVGRVDLDTLARRVGAQPGLLESARPVRSDRHRSLLAALDSAYHLLRPRDQALLDRLSAFAGPFTLEAAECLDDVSGQATTVADRLGSLVDNSMVQLRPDGRYDLLPPIRRYAADRLTGSARYDEHRNLHADVLTREAQRIDRCLRSPDEPRIHAVFDDIAGDLRVAREWWLRTGELTRLVDLCAATHWFTNLRTRAEFYRWADDAVGRVHGGVDPTRLGQARACAAMGAVKRGELARGRTIAAQGAQRDDSGSRFCWDVLGQVCLFEGRLEDAADHARRSARLHRDAGDMLWALNAASVEAVALAYDGQRARSAAQQLVRTADTLGVPSGQAMMRYILAEATTDPSEAMDLYQGSIDIAARVGAEFVVGVATTSLAARELRHGHHDRARRRLGDAIDHWWRAGVWNQGWLSVRLLIEALHRDHEHAAVAVLAAAHATAVHAGPAYGEDAIRLGEATAAARRALGSRAYDEATHRGACLSDEAALAYARGLTRPSSTVW